MNTEFKKITFENHIKKHTRKENTYSNKCGFCVLGNYEGKKHYLKELQK